ncbi:hypothetical protein SD427_03670 [Chryseobacterium sp. JJR-5R]|uniref:hypothetical protein n=1 Tax=Chryseobacterium sp. JJR-5R TaxID=3093923 RepID=UPI002A75E0AC|nr:hypothetical protein [Chryseobacterium sp. JJR-5R]WPO83452.1 hypothetical protein SD427_03670 [Chryseobacterium sp. JJR-5R]
MEIDKIREQIAVEICNDIEIWNDVLSDTSPGNYGCDHWDAEVYYSNIYVDIPARTFEVRSGSFSADLVLGASNGDSSMNFSYFKPFSAKGKFDFSDANNVKIEDINIDIDMIFLEKINLKTPYFSPR